MISFLFFVKIAQNGELRSGDLFPHVFLFPERSEKPLVYRAAAGAPFHPVRSAAVSYTHLFGSRRNAMLRMKELWSYLIHLFRDPESYAKKLRKAADPAEFEALTAGMFRELELLPGLEPGFLF